MYALSAEKYSEVFSQQWRWYALYRVRLAAYCIWLFYSDQPASFTRFDSDSFVFRLTKMCLFRQGAQYGTGQGAAMPFGWEGNRRSVVTDFSGLSVYTGSRPEEGRYFYFRFLR